MKIKSVLFLIACFVSIISIVLLASIINYMCTGNYFIIIIFSIIIIIAIVIVLILLCKRVIISLNKLQTAAKKAVEGDFDFKLEQKDFRYLEFLYEDFEKMRIKLKENKKEKSAYENAVRESVKNISHDLKIPLTAIRAYVEGILDGVASSQKKTGEYLKTIYNNINYMTALVDELNYSSQEDTLIYEFEKINASEFFNEYVKDLSLELRSKKIKFKYESDLYSDTMIELDRFKIKRVLNNIFSNAVKYMNKEEPEIQLSVKNTVNSVIIQISDNGIGISEYDLTHIFDRFYRGDTSGAMKTSGSGVGLSIVKKIVEHHHGNCMARSVLGKGTDIVIELKKCLENNDGQNSYNRG